MNRGVRNALLVVIGIWLLVFMGSCKTDNAKVDFGQFPSLELVMEDSILRLPEQIPQGQWKGIILIKFDTDCHLCQDKAASLDRDAEMLDPYLIIMVSSQPYEQVRSFSTEYHWSTRSNLLYGSVSEESFYELFEVVGAPTTLLFDSSGKEVYRFDGNPSLKPILPAFFKE